MCHRASTNPSLVGISPIAFPKFCGVARQAHSSGYTKGTRDFGSLLQPKCTFVPLEPWNVATFPGDEEGVHALCSTTASGPSLVWSSCVFHLRQTAAPRSAGRAGLDEAAQEKAWKGGEVLEQLWEGRQWGCDRAEHGRGCREGRERGGGKHSMPGGTVVWRNGEWECGESSWEENRMPSQSWDQKEPSWPPLATRSTQLPREQSPKALTCAGPGHRGMEQGPEVCPQPGKGPVLPAEAAWPPGCGHLEMPLLPFQALRALQTPLGCP